MLEAPGPKAMHFTLFKDKTDLSICSDWRVGGSKKRTDDCISGWGKGKTVLELKFNCGLSSFCQVNTKAQKLRVIFRFLQPLADEYMPLMESIYCNVIYTGKMGTALIPKVCINSWIYVS